MNALAFTSQIRPTSGCVFSTGLSHSIFPPFAHPATMSTTATSRATPVLLSAK